MALAEYYDRSALAAAQVIAGFDEKFFRGTLEATAVGLSFGGDAVDSAEGQALLDLTVRLLARFYPTVVITPRPDATAVATELVELARAVNPRITVGDQATIGIAVGSDAPVFDSSIFAGSDGWIARLSATKPQEIGRGVLPFGAGAAACLAVSQLFRRVLLSEPAGPDIEFSCLAGRDYLEQPDLPSAGWLLPDAAVLVGCGATGEAAVWTLRRSPIRGALHLVDPEPVELSNLQRYILTTRTDEHTSKSLLAAAHLGQKLTAWPYEGAWADFTAEHGYRWETVLSAVDSAAGRREVQAALPKWIANAWTQPGDLGVSIHSFRDGACLACLYLPSGETQNEDIIVATALGVPEHVVDVRTLLYNNAPVPPALLDAVAAGLGIDRSLLDSYEQLPIRRLYTEGVCGGKVLPLGAAGMPRQEVHVPLAHQSALAGVLLAARLVRQAAGLDPQRTEITRLDVLSGVGAEHTQLALKDTRGICICQDNDYKTVYDGKWPT
jgi:hypothetical protein